MNERLKQALELITNYVSRRSVGIVIRDREQNATPATGICIRIGGECLVATAGHVIEDMNDERIQLVPCSELSTQAIPFLVVVGRHHVLLVAFFVEAEHPALAASVVVPDVDTDRSLDPTLEPVDLFGSVAELGHLDCLADVFGALNDYLGDVAGQTPEFYLSSWHGLRGSGHSN